MTAGAPLFTRDESMVDVLARHARDRGDAAFLLSRHARHVRVYSYAETLETVNRLAAGLRAAGVGPGDRVHVHLPNSEWPVLALFAAGLLGASLVPTDTRAGRDDLAYVLSHARCSVSVTDTVGAVAVSDAAALADSMRRVLLVPDAKQPSMPLALPVSDLDVDAAPVRRPVAVGGLDPAAVMYTSGTTGWPKGVVLTHANIEFAGECMSAQLRMRPDDRWLAVLPFAHANLLLFSLSSALVTGASIAIDTYETESFLSLARRYRATMSSLFGGHLRALAHAWSGMPAATTHLRAIVYATSAGPEAVDVVERVSGAATVQLYGLTEGVTPSAMHDLYGERDDATCGYPTLWSRIRLQPLPERAGEDARPSGELLVHGEPGRTLMLGYLDDDDATAARIEDGWLRTGDLVSLDEAGRLTFVDRLDDLVKPLTENVSTAELERVIHEHPAVAVTAVVRAGTTAAPTLRALVVVHPGERGDDVALAAEIRDWCAERLGAYKVPDEIRIVDALPLTGVGKVRKTRLI